MDEHGERDVPLVAEIVQGVDDVGSLRQAGEQQSRAVCRDTTTAWTSTVGVAFHSFDREHAAP